jgi:hypothetical protein
VTSIFDALRARFSTDVPEDSADEMGATDDDNRDPVNGGSEPVLGDPTSSTHPPTSAGVPYRAGDPRFPDVWGRRTAWAGQHPVHLHRDRVDLPL